MFVSERMSKDVALVYPDDSVAKAFQVLKERKHSQLPVIDNHGKLVGLVTEKLLTEVSPSKATSLSVYEINYLLSKTKVSDIMKTDIFTAYPGQLIEDAAFVMKKNDIGSLPVVDNANKLVGIVTRLDIFSAFIDIMGVNEKGARIVLKVEDKLGTYANISSVVKQFGVNITHINNFIFENAVEIIIKLDTNEVTEIIKKFEEYGYVVLSVAKK
ncbi:MAG: CBS and ACT domain-containing protein [Clostridiales bacterium]|jgi:acetoin utilization protein AcuB|nr:CBS and ACT domain-containing protein [Clostridiales bacterium]